MRRIDTAYVHCAFTKPSMDIGADEIRRWHMAPPLKWDDIGYHFVIRRGGEIELGRPIEIIGAHVLGDNDHSVGIVLAGGMDEAGKEDCNYTHYQWDSLKALCQDLTDDFPGIVFKGHRDDPNTTKTCPLFDVGAWWYPA